MSSMDIIDNISILTIKKLISKHNLATISMIVYTHCFNVIDF